MLVTFRRLFLVLIKKCVISIVLVGKLVSHARHSVKNAMVCFLLTRNKLKEHAITMILMKVVISDIFLICIFVKLFTTVVILFEDFA